MKTSILTLALRFAVPLGVALTTVHPDVAVAGRNKDAAKAQANADRARASAANNMQKIANDRQKAADRHTAAAARDKGKKR